MKIVHITTAHQRFDSRIFYKECLSLKNEFNDVTLIVADGKGNQTAEGVHIIDVGLDSSRLKRLFFASKRAVKTALSLNADIYHFHDPDLLLSARKLTRNAKVIFDSHEDFPLLMLQRPYIPKMFRHLLFIVARNIERKTYKKLAGVVCATDNIRNKFINYDKSFSNPNLHTDKAISVKNYPVIKQENCISEEQNSEFDDRQISHTSTTKPFTACYVGGLTQIRGVKEMITACELSQTQLILAGPFDDNVFFEEMKALSGWKKYVTYLGVVPHKELKERVYQKADVGLNMLLSAPNHTNAIPIKQLEYMSEGLPVIATEYIRFCVDVTQRTDCGILVKPENTQECVDALSELKNNPQKRHRMGQNGRSAALNVYNWEKEKDKLIGLYRSLQ